MAGVWMLFLTGLLQMHHSFAYEGVCPSLRNVTVDGLYTSNPCHPGHSNDCTHWTVSIVIFSFEFHSDTTYSRASNFVQESLQFCDTTTSINIFEFGHVNGKPIQEENGNWSDIKRNSYFTNEQIFIDVSSTEQVNGLSHLLNYTIEYSNNAGENAVLYMFSDMTCEKICDNPAFGKIIYDFIHNMTNKNYDIRVFTYNLTSSSDYESCNPLLQAANLNVKKIPDSVGDNDIICPSPVTTSTMYHYDQTTTESKGEKKKPYTTTTVMPIMSTTVSTSLPTRRPLSGGAGLSDTELAMIIGIPCLSFLVCCGICACVCIKCTTARAKAMNNFKKWKYGESNKSPQTIEECAIEIEHQRKMGKLPQLENFATANLYMDIKLLSDKNKKDYWELPPKQLLIHETEILGSGAFANVFKGTLTGTIPLLKAHSGMSVTLENREEGSCEVAVKRLPPHADEQNKLDFFHEMQFMKRLGYHVHVISMLGCVSEPEDPLILVEYCQHGDLLHFLRTNRQNVLSNDAEKLLSVKNLVSLAWQISDGLAYLHANNFVHRDIAARNILLTNNLVAKISDFGLCRYIDSALYTAKGGKLPIKWMAIESLKFYEYSSKSDVWAYGICMWEVFSLGDGPFQGVQPLDMLKYIEDGNRLPQTEKCPNEIYQLMLTTWNACTGDRPGINEIRAKLMAMLNMDDEQYGYLDFGADANLPPLYVEGFGIQQRKIEISQENETNNNVERL